MVDYAHLEHTLTSALQLTRRPVAVSFPAAPPPGVEKFEGTQPSGCSFWRLAAEGRTFYTVPADHYNCPVGSYTHNLPLPPERERELPQMLALMSDIGYIRMEEVPGVPQLPSSPAAVVYAPLGSAPGVPEVVLFSGTPSRLMLLQEAATRAGVTAAPMLGRPTCMAIPAALSGGLASSLGCIGNRVYTDVPDDEFYVVVAWKDVSAVVGEIPTIRDANAKLDEFHRDRRANLATA